MGSYAECWLDTLYVGSTKNHFDYQLIQLFRASDKRIERSTLKDLPRAMRWASHGYGQDEKFDVVYYAAPAWIVRDRLDLKGYTLSTSKRAFMKRIRVQAKEFATPTAGLEDYYESRAAILNALDVDSWLGTLRHIKESGLGTSRDAERYKSVVTLEEFMLAEDWYGYSGVDLNVALRLALEVCDPSDEFIYDLTDLVSQEYVAKKDDCVAIASAFSAGEYSSRSKTIILTEGRSDGRIISESMKFLYPHLCDYFTFMDFETAKVEGGASQLARNVKSFAGAGIVNKVIAIFDNDTAGQEALYSLRPIKLPGSIVALRLPDIDFLKRYPTIGPSGRKFMNVNGSAASIELYLGDDVLRQNGKLPPITWKAYSPGIGKYQGSLSDADKSAIHRRFEEKLARRNDSGTASSHDWAGLKEVLSAIFAAFHRFDQRIIAQERLEQYTRD
jgi:hypothetical protein